MSPSPNPSVQTSPGLSRAQRAEARGVALQTQEAIRSLVNYLEPKHRGATAFSRLIGVERTIVQRLFSAALSDQIDESTLTRLPGPKALFTIAEAIQKSDYPVVKHADYFGGGPIAVSKDLVAIALRLESIFASAGGTQRSYAQKLLISEAAAETSASLRGDGYSGFVVPEDPSDADLSKRAVIFNAARELVGRWSRSQVQMLIFGPSKTPDMFDIVRTRGVVGHSARDGAVPLMFVHQRRGDYATGDKSAAHNLGTSDGVLEEYSSRPLPQISVTLSESIWVTTVSGAPGGETGAPFDLFLADRTDAGLSLPHKRQGAWAVDEIFSEIDYPTESLVLDVYHPKPIARLAVPNLDVHISRASLPLLRGQRWTTRFDSAPRLQIIHGGRNDARSVHYSRMSELTADIFARAGWDPTEFVGYRCEIAYPTWRCAYRIFIEYGRDVLPDNASSARSSTDAE